MPELPEVQALAVFLRDQAKARVIQRVDVAAISALKTFDPSPDALVGNEITGTDRRGKFLVIEARPLFLVIHLARAGWLRWRDAIPPKQAGPSKGPLALRVLLDDGSGFEVTEAGKEKRVAVYVVRSPEDVEGIGRLGIDPLDPGFDVATFCRLLEENGSQIKKVLTDQSLIAGVGNAYSDDALHLARLSPFKPASKLSSEDAERLHAALVSVLTDAVERSAGLPASGLKSEKRSGMRVHGRKGEPCPECGDTVREVSFATKALQYCPTCQTGGKPLADRRLSRLLK